MFTKFLDNNPTISSPLKVLPGHSLLDNAAKTISPIISLGGHSAFD
jgi:hypothetical protein